MELFIELLQIIIPSVIVFVTAYYIINRFFQNQQEERKQHLINENAKTITPIRLQAYERLIMFLERISPDSIILRNTQNVKTVKELQTNLLNSIRAEYEHNLSQQIYVSSQAWELVKSAKGQLIKLVNSTAENIDPNAPALNLSQTILENLIELKKSPVYDAIEFLKKEVYQIME